MGEGRERMEIMGREEPMCEVVLRKPIYSPPTGGGKGCAIPDSRVRACVQACVQACVHARAYMCDMCACMHANAPGAQTFRLATRMEVECSCSQAIS